MDVQVIVTTYDQPRYLALVLLALERQTGGDFGVLVADDGSGAETRAVVEAARARREIVHVWQRHQGFRKCRILNRAVAAARAEYLVFLDGDCVPRKDFLARHLALARPGRYLAGRLVRLSGELSARLGEPEVGGGSFERRAFLWREWRAGNLVQKPQYAFVPAPLGQALFRRDGGSWTGANGSAWRRDVLAVNGFDERLGYGYEDSDFGWRLALAGVRRRSVRYCAVAFHLDHARPWRDEAAMVRHRELAEESLRRGVARCYQGIDRPGGGEPEDRID